MNFYNVLAKMDGDQKFGLRISGQNGGGEGFTQEHTVSVIRGEVKTIKNTSGYSGHGNCSTTDYCILPLSPLVAIEEYEYYSDINGRREEKMTIHLWTMSRGWRCHGEEI